MKPAAILCSGMFAALAISLVAEPAEWALYDARVPLRAEHAWPPDLVSVPITERDIVSLGGWPLPAQSLVSLLESLERAGVETVVLDMFFGVAGTSEDEARIAAAMERLRVVTAITFDPAHGRRPTDDDLRAAMIPASIDGADAPRSDRSALSFPVERIASSVARLGHAGMRERSASSVRSSPPLVRVDGVEGSLPSQALAAILVHRGIDADQVRVEDGALRIGRRAPIPLRDGETMLDLAPGTPPVFSIADVLNARLGRRSLAGALAIVHVDTAEDRHASALGDTPGGLLLAAAIRTLEPEARIPRRFPAWAAIVVAASLVATAMRAGRDRRQRIIATAVLESAWLVAAFALVPVADVFLPVIPVIAVFAAGLAAVVLSDSASANGVPNEPS